MADNRIDIVFGAQVGELVAGVRQVSDQLGALTAPVQALNIIGQSFDTMLKGVLLGTQTWQEAMQRVFQNLALSFIEAVAQMILQWGAFALLGAPIANPFASGAGGIGGLIGGIGSILGFAGGTWSVPADMLAVVHAGEMIIPADLSASIRGGQASVGGAGGAAPTFVANIQALDARSVQQLFANPSALDPLVSLITRRLAARPSLQGAY
jgi:hypothetical protein